MQNVLRATKEAPAKPQPAPSLPPLAVKSRLQRTLPKPSFNRKRYFLHLPILVLGIVGYFLTGFVFLYLEPVSIRDVLVTNTYLPLLILVGLSNFFFFSYLFLNSRRGFVISLLSIVLLFLRLQQVLSFPLIIGLIVVGIIFEVILTFAGHHRSTSATHSLL